MLEARVTIVGRNYYQDVTLAPNERIYLQRQPHNEHDSNAIAAYKNSGRIFGHVISSNHTSDLGDSALRTPTAFF